MPRIPSKKQIKKRSSRKQNKKTKKPKRKGLYDFLTKLLVKPKRIRQPRKIQQPIDDAAPSSFARDKIEVFPRVPTYNPEIDIKQLQQDVATTKAKAELEPVRRNELIKQIIDKIAKLKGDGNAIKDAVNRLLTEERLTPLQIEEITELLRNPNVASMKRRGRAQPRDDIQWHTIPSDVPSVLSPPHRDFILPFHSPTRFAITSPPRPLRTQFPPSLQDPITPLQSPPKQPLSTSSPSRPSSLMMPPAFNDSPIFQHSLQPPTPQHSLDEPARRAPLDDITDKLQDVLDTSENPEETFGEAFGTTLSILSKEKEKDKNYSQNDDENDDNVHVDEELPPLPPPLSSSSSSSSSSSASIRHLRETIADESSRKIEGLYKMIEDDIANDVVAPSIRDIKQQMVGMKPSDAKRLYYEELEKRLLADMFPSVPPTKFVKDFTDVGSEIYKKRQELFKTTPSAQYKDMRNKKNFFQRFSTMKTADEYIKVLREKAKK